MNKNVFSLHRTLRRVFISGALAVAVSSFGFLIATTPSTLAQATTFTLEPAWTIPPEAPYEWVSTNNTHRGLAYNPLTEHLLTSSRFPLTNAAVYVLNSANGTLVGNLSVAGVQQDINFPINLIGVAEDGVIYACSLAVSSTNAVPLGNNGPFRIYRWQNESADPELVYEGDPSEADPVTTNQRFGDSMAIRGAGTDTQILVGTRQGTIVALFRTTDGTNFTHLKVSAPELINRVDHGPNVAMQSIAWGEGDTFYTKADLNVAAGQHPLQHFSLDIPSASASLIDTHLHLAARVGGPIAFDTDRSLLAIIKAYVVGGYPTHQLRLFKKTALGLDQQDVPVPFRSFSTTNVNGNGTGAAAFGGGKLFALDSNNGIIAFDVQEKEITTQIFWAEDGGFSGPNLGSVWRVNADGTGKMEIATALNRPIGVAVDGINGFLYWAEDGSVDPIAQPSQIVRTRLDGSERTVLFNENDHGFSNAQMLQLDVANGHVYWTDFFQGVIRGNLDGTGYTVLGGHAGSVQYTAIDLDLANGQIYFNDPTQNGVLFRMDFSGANRVELARGVSPQNFHFNTISLDVANNNLYYTDAGTHDVSRMDIGGTNATLILNDSGAIPFGIAHGPGNTLYWLARAQRLANVKIDGSEFVPSIVDVGLTPFGIAVYSAPVAGLEITGISVEGSLVTITWENGTGPFQLQRRASLTEGTWENVGAPTSENQATDTISGSQMFYQVVGQ